MATIKKYVQIGLSQLNFMQKLPMSSLVSFKRHASHFTYYPENKNPTSGKVIVISSSHLYLI